VGFLQKAFRDNVLFMKYIVKIIRYILHPVAFLLGIPSNRFNVHVRYQFDEENVFDRSDLVTFAQKCINRQYMYSEEIITTVWGPYRVLADWMGYPVTNLYVNMDDGFAWGELGQMKFAMEDGHFPNGSFGFTCSIGSLDARETCRLRFSVRDRDLRFISLDAFHGTDSFLERVVA
jgi:hypothetical protein